MFKEKNFAIYIALFFIVELLIFVLLNYQTNTKINNKLEIYKTRVSDNYDILYKLSKEYSDVTFDDVYYNKELIDLLKLANIAEQSSEKAHIREQVHQLLKSKYNSMQKIGISQFHFVLKNGESFIRFHEIGKFGDNLLDFRESVKFVLDNKIPTHTFETGRIFSGYRFVYPILDDDGSIIASVEISYKVNHILNHFEKNFFKAIFIENKESTYKKLFDDYNSNYIDFIVDDKFIISKEMIASGDSLEFIKILTTNIDVKNLKSLISKNESFTTYFKNDSDYIGVYFKAIKHNITGELLGYVILSSKLQDISDYKNIFYIGFFIVSFFVLSIFLYLFTLKRTKNELKTILNSERKLLDKVDQYVIYGKSDLSGNILDVSKAFCEVSGYSKSELIGKKFKILRHPDMPKDTFKDLWATITSGHTWQREIKNLAKDGSFYWVRVTIQPDIDEHGKIESFTAISQNITNRKRIEDIYRDLRFQVEQYNAIFDNANSGIGTIDLGGIFVQANNKFSELLSVPNSTLAGTNFLEYVDHESKILLLKALEKVSNNENIFKLPLQYKDKLGNKSYIEVSLSLLPDKQSIVLIVNSLDDKIKLQQTLEFNKTLLYAIPLPIFIQDKNFKLVECNKAFLDFFNLKKDDILGNKLQNIIGKNLYELIPQELSNLYKYQDEAKIEKNLSMYQTKLKNWLGVEKTVEIYKTTYNYEESFNGIIGVMVDISTKEEHTNKLQQTIVNKTLENIKQSQEFEEERLKSIKFQAIGQLAAGITHEINTPLTYAKGNLEMMIYDIQDMPQSQIKENLLSDSTTIMAGLERIANIVESMREMSQQTKEIKEPTNIYGTLIVALTMAHNRAKIITKIYVNSDEFEIGIDKNNYTYMSNIQKQRIEQVWIVIINNALDELVKIEPFEKRYIDIKVETKDNYHIVYFRDNAGGIPEHILKNIFQPFISNKDSSGMGVGLSIAQKIIKDNEGEILAYNDEFGAVFEVRLPCL